MMSRLGFLGVSVRRLATKAGGNVAAPVTAGKIRVNLVTPSQTLVGNTEVDQVNISSTAGDMGILSNHVPIIAQLKPGVIEIVSGKDQKKFFASGGFAIMNVDSTLNINIVEGFPVDQLDSDAIRRGLQDARKAVESNSAPVEKAKAEIEVEVYTALAHAAGVTA